MTALQPLLLTETARLCFCLLVGPVMLSPRDYQYFCLQGGYTVFEGVGLYRMVFGKFVLQESEWMEWREKGRGRRVGV